MKYRKGYKYQLAGPESFDIPIKPKYSIDTEFINLSSSGILWIRAGYAWDGASGPTKDDEKNMTPSLVHDALSQLIRQKHLPKSEYHKANVLFRKMLRERGMNWFRAWYYYRGVESKKAEKIATSKPKEIFEVQ